MAPHREPAEQETAASQQLQEPRDIQNDLPRGRLISLLEIYAIRRIQPSPEERFRFKDDDPDVIFSNDTQRYLDRILPEHDGDL